jgi:hypothetical protein
MHITTELMARMSYRDMLVVQTVLDGMGNYSATIAAAQEHLSVSTTNKQPHNQHQRLERTSNRDRLLSKDPLRRENAAGGGRLTIHRLVLRADDMSLWMLDDYNQTRFPLVRIGIKSEFVPCNIDCVLLILHRCES